MASEEATAFLRTTPIVQWQQKKLQLTLEEVHALAKAKGLRFERAEAVNSTDFELYAKDGSLVRRSNLSAIRFFIERR